MVASPFRRSLSFPASPRAKPSRPKAFHARSISLPCRSHPVISHLQEAIDAVRAWQARPEAEAPAWLCAGLSQRELLHDSLHDLLLLPQSHGVLRRRSPWTDKYLQDLLRLADAFATFRAVAVDVKQLSSESQVAARLHDEGRIAYCARSIKKIEKELAKMALALNGASKAQGIMGSVADTGEAEMAGAVREWSAVTMAASAAVLTGMAGACCATVVAVASPMRRRRWSAVGKKAAEEDDEKWRRSALERLVGMEECAEGVEIRVERMFRKVVNARVNLLNVLTPRV